MQQLKRSWSVLFLIVLPLTFISCGPFTGETPVVSITYYGPCVPAPGAATRESISYDGTSMNRTTTSYDDAICSHATMQTTVAMAVTLSASSAIVTGALNLDYVVSSVLLTVLDHALLVGFSHGHFCGVEDWMANTPTDISGKSCANGFVNGMPIYDLVKVTATALQFGFTDSQYDGITEATRPITLNPIIFTVTPAAPASL